VLFCDVCTAVVNACVAFVCTAFVSVCIVFVCTAFVNVCVEIAVVCVGVCVAAQLSDRLGRSSPLSLSLASFLDFLISCWQFSAQLASSFAVRYAPLASFCRAAANA
jgi:hypothetical protein